MCLIIICLHSRIVVCGDMVPRRLVARNDEYNEIQAPSYEYMLLSKLDKSYYILVFVLEADFYFRFFTGHDRRIECHRKLTSA